MFPFHLTQPIFRSLALFSSIPRSLSATSVPSIFTRGRAILAPRRVKWTRRHKGRVSIPTGGSLKGTVLAFGDYGLRTKGQGVRITAKQLQTAEIAVRQKIKVIKGAKVHVRVFPDIPVGVKGNETRMGKGKGGFEYWACRVPVGRVVIELESPNGAPIREEIAKQILRLAQFKLPVRTDFITRATGPKLGNLDLPMSALKDPKLQRAPELRDTRNTTFGLISQPRV